MKTFTLVRDRDHSGSSGVGTVAEGIEFSDGTVVLHWTTTGPNATGVYDSLADVETIHGHGGDTQIVVAAT